MLNKIRDIMLPLSTVIIVVVFTVVTIIQFKNNKMEAALISTTVVKEGPQYVAMDFYSLNMNLVIQAAESYPARSESIFNAITECTGNRRVTEAIVRNCIAIEVPIPLAMGIAWTESRFFPKAVNGIHNANGTSDWGLFQVNDVNIPKEWSREDKLDVDKNAELAIKHIKELLDYYDDNYVLVIAAYNAGKVGIEDGIGADTLHHINSTLEYKIQFEKKMSLFLLTL